MGRNKIGQYGDEVSGVCTEPKKTLQCGNNVEKAEDNNDGDGDGYDDDHDAFIVIISITNTFFLLSSAISA